MKTLLAFVVVVVGIGAAGTWYWTASREEGPRFRESAVERGDLLIAVSASGTIEPEEVIDVGAQIVGRIRSFGPDLAKADKTVDFCSEVKEGAILAQLDDLPQKAARDKACANLKLAQAELQRSQARLRQTERDFQRAETLRDTNAESEYDMDKAEYEMAQADVAVAEAQLEQANIAMQQAEIQLGYTTIQAPIDGILIDRRVNVGQTVVAGLNAPSLFLLARDLDRMRVWAAVNEADIGDIYVGQEVTFSVDAYRDKRFVGTVSQIRLNASMSHNVVIYGVMIDVENADGTLLPYMTASIQFEVARRSDIVLVPNQALRWRPTPEQITPNEREVFCPLDAVDGDSRLDEEGKVLVDAPTLWVIAEDGLVRHVEISTGLTDGMFTELLDGDLNEGDRVVAASIRKAEKDFVSSFISKVTKTRSGT